MLLILFTKKKMTKKDHKTAILILKVARKLFIRKGFAATSISEIAKECNINKSLIYHHFENKESLWKAIKGEMISTYIDLEKKESDFSARNLMELLEKMVTLRFDFYTQNPDIIRLILFQKLEANSKKLEGVPDNKYNDISVQVKQLQDNGEIRKDIDADFASYLIFTNAVNLLIDQYKGVNKSSTKDKEQYLKTIINFLYNALKA